MIPYLVLVAVVYAVALLPIFGPPVWIVLVVAKVRWDLNPVLLVGLGAIAATAGRLTLARMSRHLTRWVPQRAKENLEAAHEFLDSHEKGILALLVVFIVSPWMIAVQVVLAVLIVALPLMPWKRRNSPSVS